MKTRDELEAMTKPELDAYGDEALVVQLDGRLTKGKLIDKILELQAAASPDESATDTPPADAPKAKGMVRVTVTRFPSSSGVPLHINGRDFHLPIGKTVPVPAWVVPTLHTVDGLEFTQE